MPEPMLKSPPVLLGSASSGGTIAAMRQLSSYGVGVNVIVNHPFCPAGWSRYAKRRYAGPVEIDSTGYLDRLLAIGKSDPGQVLLPTSDELAWLYTANASLLARYFRLYQPPIETIKRILDKALLETAASIAGLAVLPSWSPQSLDELAELAPHLPYPVLIKPRTHVNRLRNDKGVVVHSPGELRTEYLRFLVSERRRFDDTLRELDSVRPVIQKFVNIGPEGVVSISGFIGRSADVFVTRRSTKIFQRSRPVGVGVCYESCTADPALSQAVHRICRELDYFGLFEVEFILHEGAWTVIDFNPRLFNQIGLDLRRGLPLPMLAYLDALGETAAVRTLAAEALRENPAEKIVFCDKFTLNAILLAQTLCMRAQLKDLAQWRDWTRRNRARMVHFAADRSDPMPGVIHILSELNLGFRAAPRFVRTMLASSPPSRVRAVKTRKPQVAIIGGGPYGLSLASHFADRNVAHRIFGQPMAFWTQTARAGARRYLKSYCFGTNISSPRPGFTFADYNEPRGLETFEPCSIANFAEYGLWFQEKQVDWIEPVNVANVRRSRQGFILTLSNDDEVEASDVIVATGLSNFAKMPNALRSLPGAVAMHTSNVDGFAAFQGLEVAVVGAGQSALETAALLVEAGASPRLLIRDPSIRWMTQGSRTPTPWQQIRSPISALGGGPKAWALTQLPGAFHRLPSCARTLLLKNFLPPEGAWWLRERVEARTPVELDTNVVEGRAVGNRVSLRLRRDADRKDHELLVDRVIAGTGYEVDVERIAFLAPELRSAIARHGSAPRLDASFQTSIPGLRFVGPASSTSFGPMFRFVAGAEYTARTIARALSRATVAGA
jgi:predicted ATP-grasp superfamily ATP-dependent carboligase